jgi:NitT/TauT family transport system substrate-binding protein
MKRNRSMLVLILIVAISVKMCFGSPMLTGAAEFKPEKNKIKLGVAQPSTSYLPVYLALDKGFFEKEGLTVELIEFSGGSELIKGVIAGSIDVGYSGLASLSLGINAGQKIKVFYAGNNLPAFYWHAVPKIRSLAEAKGARIGVSRYGSNSDFMTRYALKTYGLNPEKDVQIVQAGNEAAALAAMEKGQLDVIIVTNPYGFMAEDKGYKAILKQKDLTAEYPMQDLFGTEKFLKDNPNTIKAFLRGYSQGVRLAKKERDLAVKILVERVSMEKKYAGRAYDEIIEYIYEDGRWPSEKSMDTFWEMGILAGTYKEKWPREKYFDNTFVGTYSVWKP